MQSTTMFVDRNNIWCSRAIVSLQSPFLRSLLSSHPGHLVPVVACPGLRYSDLCSLLAIVYTGQVIHITISMPCAMKCEIFAFCIHYVRLGPHPETPRGCRRLSPRSGSEISTSRRAPSRREAAGKESVSRTRRRSPTSILPAAMMTLTRR